MTITENLIQSWRLLKGSKIAVWAASLAWILLSIVTLVIITVILTHFMTPQFGIPVRIQLFLFWLVVMLSAPFVAGMNMIGIKRARGETVSMRTGFGYFSQLSTLTFAFLLISIICGGIILALGLLVGYTILPFFSAQILHHDALSLLLSFVIIILFNLIYTPLIFMIPLIADRKLGALAALIASIKISKKNGSRLFALMTVFSVINFLAMLVCNIPFIGLIGYVIINIWFIPFVFLSIGVAYHQLVDRDQLYAQPLLSPS